MKILCEERKIYYCAPEEIGCARAEMMNALGRRLVEMLADLPKGKEVRVSYMEARNHTWEENPLEMYYKIQLTVQEIPGRPENEVEPDGGVRTVSCLVQSRRTIRSARRTAAACSRAVKRAWSL